MNTKLIMDFLRGIAANNNREWFAAHRDDYEAAKAEFEKGVGDAILEIAKFDTTIAHLAPKDCCYRFYRDVRFSADKSPYKRHFGAYVSAHGKKGLHGGYYIHLQPGQSLLAAGAWWLPTNILTSVRNEIMGNIDDWRQAVENKEFVQAFGKPNAGKWSEDDIAPKGFGIGHLKKAPKGFPTDYPYLDYLKMKDYCVWIRVSDDFFSQAGWTGEMARAFKVAKPMMDFTNSVIDDYE